MFKKIIIGILLIIGSLSAFSQPISYTVTTQSLSATNTGALDFIMNQAISDANAGHAVTIYFDAPGLVQLTALLPQINISFGSITFDRTPATTAVYPTIEQGIQCAGTVNDPNSGVYQGFYINGNSASSSVTIQNLKITDFSSAHVPALVLGKGMEILGGHNLKVDHCKLENNSRDIELFYCLNNVEISNNNFTGPGLGSGIYFTTFDFFSCNNSVSTFLNIHHNIFSYTATSFSQDSHGVEVGVGRVLNGQIKIEDNQFYHADIKVQTGLASSMIDPLVTMDINRNTFSQCYNNISLYNPLPYWKINNNIFDADFEDIYLYSTSDLPNIYGLNFIAPNTLDGNENNGGNTFGTQIQEYSFAVHGSFGAGNKIEGLTIPPVVIMGGNYTIVRNCKMRATGLNRVIRLFPENNKAGNGSIPSPTIQSISTLSGSNFSVTYQLSNLNSSNSNFAVDFYTSNANGDLVDYIGNQTVSGNGTYTAALTLPVNVPAGNYYAATLTSLGDQPGSAPLGTSEVVAFGPCPQITMTSASNVTIASGGTATIPLTSSVPSTYTWVTDGNPLTSQGTGSYSGTTLTATIVNNDDFTPQTVTYTVTPTSSTAAYCTGTPQVVTVTINPACYTDIDFTTSHSGCDNSISFTPEFSRPKPTSQPGSTFTWDFGDGSTEVVNYDDFFAHHTYAQDGVYTVTLTFHSVYSTCSNIFTTQSVYAYKPVQILTASTPTNTTTVKTGDAVTLHFDAYWPAQSHTKYPTNSILTIGNDPPLTISTVPGDYVWTPTQPGTYSIIFTSHYSDFSNRVSGGGTSDCSVSAQVVITVICGDCTPIECKDCIASFAPLLSRDYVLSAWVQQSNAENLVNYTAPTITLTFPGAPSSTNVTAIAKGAIIDGWQRIDETFTVPIDANDIEINLNNTGGSGTDVYFDDVRIHPLKSSLKSFVYDPVTMRLMAELDENNYATFYEYDEEGALIRVKKETERGVKTIKESGNSIRKNTNQK